MYADYLDRLPDSADFGVLNAFTFDGDDWAEDDLQDEIENEAFYLQDKYLRKHSQKEVKLNRFWNEAKRIVKARRKKETTQALKATLKRLKTSKYKVLVAITNHSDQQQAEAFLRKLGFRLKLKFTNPNHNRVDTLNLWLLKK